VRLTNGGHSFPKFERLRERKIFDRTVAVYDDELQVRVGESLRTANALLVSGEYFEAIGANPSLGRTIQPEDEKTRAPVAVLDHAFWRQAFQADPDVVGKSLIVNQVAVTIVGVTQPAFKGIIVGRRTDLTMPITAYPILRPEIPDALTRRSMHWLNMLAVLKPGDTLAKADAALQVAWASVLAYTAPEGTPPTDGFFRDKTHLEPGGTGFSPLRRTYTSPLYILMGLVVLVLLVACANVANLLIARAAARHHEFAIRQSLGAGRSCLIRQLLTESLLLSTLAGAAGIAIAYLGARYLAGSMSNRDSLIALDLKPDWRVLAFTTGMAIASAVLFGLAPALRGSRVNLATDLKESSRNVFGAGTARKLLVVVQIGLAMILAAGSGLFLGSLRRVLSVDLGFRAQNVVLMRADAVNAGYREKRVLKYFADLRERASAIPGVQAAALAYKPPVSRGSGSNGPVAAQGQPPRSRKDSMSWHNIVSPGYLDTIGQRLVAGRDFNAQDRPNGPRVAIVNQTMARHFFGNGNPLGRRIDTKGGTDFTCEVVGVVRDAVHFDPKEKPQRVFYLAYEQGPEWLEGENMILAVRSQLPPESLHRQLFKVSADLDKNVLAEIETLQSHVDVSVSRESLLARLSAFLGALAVILVGIGIYGVMAWSVTRRTSEIGVRMALGAQARSVMGLVLREGLVLVAAGILLGGAAAYGLSRLVESMLFGVTARDTAAFAGAVAVVAAVALLATALPALRAARIDPLKAIRYE